MLWPISKRSKTYRTSPLRASLLPVLNGTQAKVPGFDLAPLQAAHVYVIGAGGIGSPTAATLVRKGVGTLSLIDYDHVEWSNLTRQLFTRDDVGKSKVHCLARSLAATGMFPTTIHAHPFTFQKMVERGHDFGDATLFIVGVDNNRCRQDVAAFAIERNIPVIYAAVSRGGNEAYCMVQQPRKACWGCVFPIYLNDDRAPCGLPAIADILLCVAGEIVFAVDTLIADRPRQWTVRETFLDGALPDRARHIPRRTDCAICGYVS